MEIVLVTFADKAFENSRKELIKEAKRLKYFSKYFSYTPSDLPLEVRESLFLKGKKGLGYWVWKPIIIKMSLERIQEGDVLVYVDSGSKLQESFIWKEWLGELNSKNSIFFRYNSSVDYKWHSFGINSTKLGYWCHQTLKDYFDNRKSNIDWYSIDKLLAGVFFIKKSKENNIINKWSDLALTQIQLFADEIIEVTQNKFNSHRHDQSVLSILVHLYSDEETLILDEIFESSTSSYDSPILTVRRKLNKIPFVVRVKLKLSQIIYNIFNNNN
jgi:hypothetical protein